MSKAPRGRAARVAVAGCAALLALAPSARAAFDDPLFVFTPAPIIGQPLAPPPAGYLNGPCGAAVDSAGHFYISDYYHHTIDVFSPTRTYKTQIAALDPTDGPCGLAVGAAGQLYVNDYHRDVALFSPTEFPPTTITTYGAGPIIDPAVPGEPDSPTGVAVDPATGNLYVDNRTRISAYDAAGAPLLDEGEPVRIGEGSLLDGYGIAVSSHPATAGWIYVPDAGSNTIKVYDPALDLDQPVSEIAGPDEGFVSLRDSAIAIDRISGEIYVADNLQPAYVESPEAAIHVFSALHTYKGHLKHAITDALPPGLAVDNSITVSGGRVYVTSGNGPAASVYIYPPGAATKSPLLPPLGAGGGAGGASSAAAPSAPSPTAPASAKTSGTASAPLQSTAAAAERSRAAQKRRARRRAAAMRQRQAKAKQRRGARGRGR